MNSTLQKEAKAFVDAFKEVIITHWNVRRGYAIFTQKDVLEAAFEKGVARENVFAGRWFEKVKKYTKDFDVNFPKKYIHQPLKYSDPQIVVKRKKVKNNRP